MLEERRRSPRVADDLGVRAAVDEDDDRILPRRVEVRGLDEPRFEAGAVIRADVRLFRRRELVFFEPVFGPVDDAVRAAARIEQR